MTSGSQRIWQNHPNRRPPMAAGTTWLRQAPCLTRLESGPTPQDPICFQIWDFLRSKSKTKSNSISGPESCHRLDSSLVRRLLQRRRHQALQHPRHPRPRWSWTLQGRRSSILGFLPVKEVKEVGAGFEAQSCHRRDSF